MKLHAHVTFSAIISGLLYLSFKSWGLAISSFIIGVFIDLDHFVDYIREYGWRIKVKDFFDRCYTCQFDRIMLLWHGWEWMALLSISAWLTDWNPWVTGALIGYSHHIILDMLSNSNAMRSYSLIWKWKNDFHFDTIFSNLKHLKYKSR